MRPNSKPMFRPASAQRCVRLTLLVAVSAAVLLEAVLVQPHNYMLDDSPLTSQHDSAGSLSPFYNDQTGASEHAADKDIVSIIGDGLARLRFARMLEQGGQDEPSGQLSQEMAELIQEGQQQQQQAAKAEAGDQSLSSSVASMLMNVAQAAAAAQAGPNDDHTEHQTQQAQDSRGPILELDTSQSSQSAGSQPSKSDLKAAGPSQWYNPKETIPVLKISSMATPSKYKKVYFRSEKKLVDGAFHSPASDQDEKKPPLAAKPFNSAVQRRSSRGSSAAAPPSVLQDGVIDFLKKFRDVYVQTRPASGAASSSGSSLAANLVSAASSPFAAMLAPASAGSRPNLASALSTASQMVNSAAMLSQAAANSVSSSSSSPATSGSGGATASGAAAAATGAGASGPSKSPLSAQTYVSFWSKTFPTWVRKMLKQMRRRSLYNSSKRQQHQQHAHGIGQKVAGSSAVSGIVADSAAPAASSSSS